MISRIKQLLDWQQLSPTQFADRIGIGRPVVSHILSERNKPSLDVVQRIIAAFPELSLPWLLSGTGAMLANGGPAVAAEPMSLATSPAPTELPAGIPTAEAPFVALAGAQPAASAGPVAPPAAPQATPTTSTAKALPPARGTGTPLVTPAPAFRVAAAGRPVVSSRPVAAQPPRFRPAGAPTTGPSAPTVFPVMNDAAGLSAASADTVVASQAASAGDLAAPGPAGVAGPVVAPAMAGTAERLPVGELARATGGGPVGTGEAIGPPPPENAPAAPWLAGLSEPGKAIRRIVIFYRDGSFADYQPES